MTSDRRLPVTRCGGGHEQRVQLTVDVEVAQVRADQMERLGLPGLRYLDVAVAQCGEHPQRLGAVLQREPRRAGPFLARERRFLFWETRWRDSSDNPPGAGHHTPCTPNINHSRGPERLCR